MAQSDYLGSVPDGSGADVRAGFNEVDTAVATEFAGDTAPTVFAAWSRWNDTANGIRKRRNAANTAWEFLENYAATTDPDAADNGAAGWVQGARWSNTTAKTEWVLEDPSTTAVWVQVGAGGAVDSVDGQTGAVDLSGTYQPIPAEGAFDNGDKAKLDGIEAGAVAAGAAGDAFATGHAASASAHNASAIVNDSGVSGAKVSDALDNLSAGAVSDTAVLASIDRLRGETILSRAEYYRTLADDRNRRYVVRADDYVKRWVAFDGASGLLRSSQPTGVADGKEGTVEAFVKFTGGNGADQQILAGFYTFVFGKGTDDKIYVNGRNAGGTLIMQLKSSTTYTDADGELHILASWDLTDSNKRHLYVNGVDVLDTVATYTNDTVDHTRVTAVGNDGGGTPASFFVGLLERVGLWQSYMDLSDPAVMAMFGPGDTLADLGGDGILADGTAPAMFFRGPAADFPACRAGDYALDFTVLGTLTDGPSNKGYWHTVGRHLYGPDGRQGRLVGFRFGYDGAAVTTQDFVDYRDTDGVNFNCIAYELWWAMDNDTNPGEPTPSAPGVYNTLALVRAKEKMRAAVRAGLWIIPSLRVSWGTASAIASNLAADGGDWQGWADHAKLINDEAIAAPGTGNYKARFFAWMKWIMAELLADPEIAGAIAYWELWHFPWHNQGAAFTNTLADLYSDTFVPDMIAAAREIEPHRCLGVSYRHKYALSRAYAQSVKIVGDNNLLYVTGGYGSTNLLMVYPGSSSETWPPSGTDDAPEYSSGDSQFEFVLWSADQNIAFHSQEGPGLHTSKQVEPLNASVKTFLEGLGTLYNTHAHGMCWHAWSNRPTAAAGTELGDIIRSQSYFGGADLYHEERQPIWPSVHGASVAVVLRPGVHNAYFNWLAIKAAIAECHRLGVKCLVLPAGYYYVDGSIRLAGPHLGLDADGGSGLLVEGWDIVAIGCTLAIPPSPTLTNFVDHKSPVLDGDDYADLDAFWAHNDECLKWDPGCNRSTKVGEGSFSAAGSDYTYNTSTVPLGMAVENGGTMSRLIQVSTLGYGTVATAITGTTVVGQTSGATARIVRTSGGDTMWLTSVKGTFQNGEQILAYTTAGAAAGDALVNGTINLYPTTINDGEWALDATPAVRVGTKTTGDTFWLVTNDAGNLVDQGGRLIKYKVFWDMCGMVRCHIIGTLTLVGQDDQYIHAMATSRQGPKDSNSTKTGGRGNLYPHVILTNFAGGLMTNPIGGAVWNASSPNNEDGQFPSWSKAQIVQLDMNNVIRPWNIDSDRGDCFVLGSCNINGFRATARMRNINANLSTIRGVFNSEVATGTRGQDGHDCPGFEFISGDFTFNGEVFVHSGGAAPTTAGMKGIVHVTNAQVIGLHVKPENVAGRADYPYLVTFDNSPGGSVRSKANGGLISFDSNCSLSNVKAWLAGGGAVHLVTHSYTGSTRDSRGLNIFMPMIEAADVTPVVVSGGYTTADIIEIWSRDNHGHYRVVAGALVPCDGNGLRHSVYSTDPTVNSDEDLHYGVGSRWINDATNREFVCADATAGAAVWSELSLVRQAATRPVTLQSSSYNAAAGDRVLVDVSGGGFPVILPDPPSDADRITVVVAAGDIYTDPVTVDGNGNTIWDGFTEASTYTIDGGATEIPFVWDGSNSRWIVCLSGLRAVPLLGGYASGSRVLAGGLTGSVSNSTLSTQYQENITAFIFNLTQEINGISVYLATGQAGATGCLALYELDAADMQAYTRIARDDTISFVSAGAKTLSFSSRLLVPGRAYGFGVASDTTGVQLQKSIATFLPWTSQSTIQPRATGQRTQASLAACFPDPYGAAPSLLNGGNAWLVGLEVT